MHVLDRTIQFFSYKHDVLRIHDLPLRGRLPARCSAEVASANPPLFADDDP